MSQTSTAQKAVHEGKRDTVLVLDFGGQYTHLISRRVRELGVYSEVIPCNTSIEAINELGKRFDVKGIILSGGPDSVYSEGAPTFDERILQLEVPVLGLCYGHQLLAKLARGRVEHAEKQEYGTTKVTINIRDGLLSGTEPSEKVWMSHGDTVFELPPGYQVLAHSDNSPIAAFRNNNIYGLQWHPEVTHTERGMLMLGNFVHNICGCDASWQTENLVGELVEGIKTTVGNARCVVTLSGGVDSSTASALVARAVGSNLIVVYVDTGLMREGETEEVRQVFGTLGVDLRVVDAKARFMTRLKEVSDPEQKRKIIGDEFGRIFDEVGREIDADYLVQGTIYPDRVESGATGKAAKIKTHHNVGGLPKDLKFKGVVEPLRDLYKYETRKLAVSLGLPPSIAFRQPFPGPGLAIRVMGEVTEEKLDIERKADHIVTEEIERIADEIGREKLLQLYSQYFAVLTDTMSTGVKGDSRAYGHTVAVRVIRSEDFMTGNFARVPDEVLDRISTRITNEIPSVNRVVYDITNKPPATVEWE